MSAAAGYLLDGATLALTALGALPGPLGIAARVLAAGAAAGSRLAHEAPGRIHRVRGARALIREAVAHAEAHGEDIYEEADQELHR